ncbi:MAG: glycosyltransferase family 4 protein [Actinomycetota bacterium]|nr:glycosyltransferase family 4 protein [Actinomycetota bacterium]
MRIAVVAPPWISVPPAGYGGIEWVVSLLVEELVRRAHDVTLFASGGSQTKAELISVFDDPPTSRMHENVADARHAAEVVRVIQERAGTDRAFDVVHDHSACIMLAAAPLLPVPLVHTLHGAFTEEMRNLYRQVAHAATFVAISETQRAGMPELPVRAIVPNSVDADAFTFAKAKQDYLLCLGRVSRPKGQDVAIEVAQRAGMPLVLAGKVDPGDDTAYFDREILPYVDGQQIRFEGEVPDERKRELMAGARAMLFPIRWPEPFGLVMVEAMASGTPVIATRQGAVPEVVRDGVTGFIVEKSEDMPAALQRLDEIDPAACRNEAEKRFSPAVMADGYERIYEAVVMRRGG